MLASKLRTLLTEVGLDGKTALTAAFGCYRLDLPGGTWVDVLEAALAVREAESLLAADEPERAAAAAVSAEPVARLTFLAGDDGPWVEAKRRELADVRIRALTILAEATLRTDKPTAAIRWAEQAIEAEPFRESSYRLLMTAHVAAGNRAEALRVYENCRRLLADELGTYPSPETDSIYRGLLETPTRDSPPTGEMPPPGEGPPRLTRRRRFGAVALVIAVVAAIAAFALASSGGSALKLRPDSVIRIDPSTLKVKQVIPVGTAPDLVVASGGYIWVASHILRDTNSTATDNGGDHTLTRVDPATGKGQVVAGVEPCGMAPDPSGDVWVADCYRKSSGEPTNIIRVAATTLKFKETILVPGGNFFYRGIAYGGGSLWLSNPSTSGLSEVDPHTKAVKVIPVNACCSLAWSDAYDDVWMNSFDGATTVRVDPATKALLQFGGGVNPASVAVDGNAVWVADWGAPQVLRISATGSGLLHVVPLAIPAKTGCPKISCVWTVAAGGGYIWAASPRARAVFRIDPKTNHVTALHLPYRPVGVTVDTDNNVWVTVRAAP